MKTEFGLNDGMNDKVALITGSASGIGKACAELIAKAGAKVAALDIDEKLGQETVQSINDQGGEAMFLNCDVSVDHSCREAIGRCWFDAKPQVAFAVEGGGSPSHFPM